MGEASAPMFGLEEIRGGENCFAVSTMNRSTRHSTALQSLVSTRELTPAGAQWVTQTLDPFHDWEVTPTGYPDTTVGNSFIQTVNLSKTYTMSAPSDVSIFTLPQLGTRTMYQQGFSSPTVLNPAFSASYGLLGPLNVVVTAGGQATMPGFNPLTQAWLSCPAPTLVDAFDLSPYLVGDTRLVGIGFEVHNTSPELVKSGAVVTYKTAQSTTDSMIYTVPPGGAVVADLVPVVRSVMPPATAAEALLLAGSQQWEAYDGAYVVGSLAHSSNPIDVANYKDQIYEPTFTPVPDAAGYAGIGLVPRVTTLFPNSSNWVQSTPWNTVGAYFTGLAVNSVLTVNLKAFIECFPSSDQVSYVSLTRPSNPFDPLALELYARASFLLKPGTLVQNNPDGEHWQVVKDVLDDIVPRLSRAASMTKSLVTGVKKARSRVEDAQNNSKIFGIDALSIGGDRKRGILVGAQRNEGRKARQEGEASAAAPPRTGLSRGQRQRRNAAAKKASTQV